jgi:hypothetical protein
VVNRTRVIFEKELIQLILEAQDETEALELNSEKTKNRQLLQRTHLNHPLVIKKATYLQIDGDDATDHH